MCLATNFFGVHMTRKIDTKDSNGTACVVVELNLMTHAHRDGATKTTASAARYHYYLDDEAKTPVDSYRDDDGKQYFEFTDSAGQRVRLDKV